MLNLYFKKSFSSKIFTNNHKFKYILKYSIFPKFFSTTTTPATTSAGAVTPSTGPTKTKDQLKVEELMKNWPIFLRENPNNNLTISIMKERLETILKFHQGDKGIIKQYDIPADIFTDVSEATLFTFTTDTIAFVLNQYEGYITDDVICGKFYEICTTHKDTSRELFEVILPQVKKQISLADRQSNEALAKAVIGAANICLHDTEFWNIVVNI
jgi:hypothetical protein